MIAEVKSYFRLAVVLVMLGELARYQIRSIFKKESKAVSDKEYLLEMALPNNVTIEMGLWMYRLSQYPEFKKVKTWKTFEKKLNEQDFSSDFLEDWNAFIAKHGIRAYRELDIKFPRTHEDLEGLREKLRLMSENGTRSEKKDTRNEEKDPRGKGIVKKGAVEEMENPLQLHEKTKRAREKAFEELFVIAEKRGKGKKFEKGYQNLLLFSGYRESPKYFMVAALDIIKQKALSVGKEFMKQKRLDKVEDIFDLKICDISQGEQKKKLDLRALRAERLKEYNTWKGVSHFPKFFDSRGKIFTMGKVSKDKNTLLGTAISPGVVRGKVKILRSANEKPLLPGEILVTRATDPGWTPLFVNAAGILLEVGGVLQHGALVAREYGKPCIAGLEGIMEKLEDGQEVEIDGANGVVRKVEKKTRGKR